MGWDCGFSSPSGSSMPVLSLSPGPAPRRLMTQALKYLDALPSLENASLYTPLLYQYMSNDTKYDKACRDMHSSKQEVCLFSIPYSLSSVNKPSNSKVIYVSCVKQAGGGKSLLQSSQQSATLKLTHTEEITEDQRRRWTYMTNVPITVAYGDGIGPEIMDATLRIITAAGARIEIEKIEVGEQVYLRGIDTGIEPSAWESLRRTRVFLKAPITTPQGGGYKSLNVTTR